LAIAGDTVDENAAEGTVVGTLSATDADGALNPLTYSLVDDAGGAFALAGNTITVLDGSLLDYENVESGLSANPTITVEVSDGTFAQQEDFVVDLQDVNDTIQLGDGGYKSIKYMEPDGTNVRIRLRKGSAKVGLDQPITDPEVGSSTLTLADPAQVRSIQILNSSDLTSLTVSTGGTAEGANPFANIGAFVSSGDMKSIVANKLDVTGMVAVGGSIRRINLHDLQGAAVSVGTSASEEDVLRIKVNDAANASLVSGMSIRSIVGRDLAAMTITTTDNSDLTMVRAAELGGIWSVAGDIGTVRSGVIDNWQLSTDGDIRRVQASEDVAGIDISAQSLAYFNMRGAASDLQIELDRAHDPLRANQFAMRSFRIGGSGVDINVQSASSIRQISAGTLSNAAFFAGIDIGGGVDTSALSVDDSIFESSDVAIKRFVIRGNKGATWVDNVVVAAPSLGYVKVGFSSQSELGNPFGFMAKSSGSVSYRNSAKAIKLYASDLVDPNDYEIDGDLIIRIV